MQLKELIRKTKKRRTLLCVWQITLKLLYYFNSSAGKVPGGTPSSPPSKPAQTPNAPAADTDGETPQQGAATGSAMPTERDISAGETPSPGPEAP